MAVITKLDLMDHGTDAMDILYGRGKHYTRFYMLFYIPNTARFNLLKLTQMTTVNRVLIQIHMVCMHGCQDS